MQKIKIFRILPLICVAVILMLGLGAEAMLWDNGYGVKVGEPGPQRMLMTFQNLRSIIFVLGFLTLFVLLVLSIFKKMRKKCLKITGVLVILLFIVAISGQVVDYLIRRDFNDQEAKLAIETVYTPYGLCDMVSYGHFNHDEAETEFMDEIIKNNLYDTKCEYNETLLSRCAYKGWNRAVDLLLSNGVDVNAKGYQGNTALHWAFLKLNDLADCHSPFCSERQEKYREIINSLLEHGADTSLKNDSGELPKQAKMR
ncbi:MAG: ankyrin repeat domain-containing protein [Pseudomonadota bacterium]|nr:ankyrin repeat domain-containing protein [Pseudomonadota bacterium]